MNPLAAFDRLLISRLLKQIQELIFDRRDFAMDSPVFLNK
jgi:hypothetical protein